MKKVLFVSDFKIAGGAEEVCLNTYEFLKEQFDCYYFVASEKYKKPSNPFSYIFSIYYFVKFYFYLRDKKPDIIHIHSYFHLLTPAILLSVRMYRLTHKNTKLVLTAHEYHLICPSPGMFYLENDQLINFPSVPKFRELIFKKIDQRGHLFSALKKTQWFIAYKILRLQNEFDLILCPSEFLKEFYRESGIKASLKTLRNPIPEANISSQTKILEKNKLRILFFGRISFEKGIKEFVDEIKKNRALNIELNIIGDGPDFDKIKTEHFDHLTIQWLGRKNKAEIQRYCSENDVFILPSLWYENAPLSILEAYFFGMIILTKNYGGMKEMAELCENYFLYDQDNLNEKLVEISKLDSIQFMKRKSLQETFSSQNYVHSLINYYSEIHA